jgi:short-subunit dehydrogenase
MAFRDKYGPWAIVAGASEGTGASFARQLAERGLSLILIARDGPLDEVAAEARSRGVEVIAARIDLARPDAAERINAAAGEREIGL